MAKRDTTGGPKKRQRTQADIERQRSYLSKAQREKLFQRRLLIGIGTLAVVIIILIAGALLNDQVLTPRQAITTVNDQEVSIADFGNRLQYERFRLAEEVRSFYEGALEAGLDKTTAQNQTLSFYSGQQSPRPAIDYLINSELFAQQVLEQVEREIIIEQAAKQYGIEAQVDEAEVQAAIDEAASLLTGRSATETPSPTPSDTPTVTLTPLVSATPSNTPTETPTPSDTPVPTVEGCAEGEECATVTPAPTSTPTETSEFTATPFETATPTATYTPITAQEAAATVVKFEQLYFEKGKEFTGLDEDAIRQFFYYQALTEAFRDFLTSNREQFGDYYVGEQEIWVDTRHILISFPEGEVPPEGDDNEYFKEAQRIVEALRNGAPFAALAQAESGDPGSGSRGGSLGWASSASYVEEFKEAVESLPLGEISDPVRSQFGYHIIQVMDRELREVSPQQLEQRRNEALERWVTDQRLTARIQRRDSWQDFVPEQPDYNALLSDILPEYDPNTGFGG